MELPRKGIEYAHWSYSGSGILPEDIQMSVDGGAVWRSVEADGPYGIKVLLAGPDAVDSGGALVVPLGEHNCVMRVVDAPEVILRPAGSIEVV